MTTDPLDDRIRTLVGRAVAETPVAPDVGDLADPAVEVLLAPGPLGGRSRPRRALVAGIAAALLLVIGVAVVLRQADERGSGTVASAPVESGRVRYVLDEELVGPMASWSDAAAPADLVALPPSGGGSALRQADELGPVALFERSSDGVLVRVTDKWEADGFGDGETTFDDDARWLAEGAGLDAEPTTVLGVDAQRRDQPALDEGGRPGTTFWVRQGEHLVTIEVFGAPPDQAADVLTGFTPRTPVGFDPPPGAGFTTTFDLPATEPGEPGPIDTTVAYGDGPGYEDDGPGGITVSTSETRPGRSTLLADRSRFDGGSLERWGGRDVLVAIDWSGVDAEARLLDEHGLIVTVGAPVDRIRQLVEGLRPVGPSAWQALVDAGSEALAAVPMIAGSPTVVGDAEVSIHDDGGPLRGYCLTLGATTTCRPGVVPPRGVSGYDATHGASVLVDGRWWMVGRMAGELGEVGVAADRGGKVEVTTAESGEDLYFLALLPEDATTAELQYRSAVAGGGSASFAPWRRPAS